MKKVLFIMAAALLIFTGCKKDKTETPAGNNTWTADGKTYNIAYTAKSEINSANGGTLVIFADAPFNDPNVNTFNLSFKVPPATSGTYQLVGGAGGTLTDKQFELYAGNAAGGFIYLGTPVDVNIEVTGGKMKVTIPEITFKRSPASGETTLTASVYEK